MKTSDTAAAGMKISTTSFRAVRALAALCGAMLLAAAAAAQGTRLEIILHSPDGRLASGTIVIAGADTAITDESFAGSKTYILEVVTGLDDGALQRGRATFGPNPAGGMLTVAIEGGGSLEGTLEAWSLSGRELGRIVLQRDSHMRIATREKTILLRYTGADGVRQTAKIISNTGITDIVVTVRRAVQAAPAGGSQGARTASQGYEARYEDPSGNLDTASWRVALETGEKHTIEETLRWTEKAIYWQASTNSGTTVTVTGNGQQLDEATSADGKIGERKITGRFDGQQGLSVRYTLAGPYTDTARIDIRQKADEKITLDTVRNGHYHLTVTGNGESYTVRHNGAAIYSGAVGTTAFMRLPGDRAQIALIVSGKGLVTDTTEFEMQKGELAKAVQLAPVTWDYRLTGSNSSPDGALVSVWEGGHTLATATISGVRYATGTWSSTGTAMTIDSVTFGKDGYLPQTFTAVEMAPGDNTLEANLQQAAWTYWLWDDNSSPEGTTVKAWKDGAAILSGTVSGGAYETNRLTTGTATLAPDSITATADGYEKETIPALTMEPQGTQLTVNLQKIYTIDLIITEETGDTILTGKTINIKEPDGDITSKTITQKHTTINIKGNYKETETIKIWLTPDNEYDGLTGTINQSLKNPINSTWKDTLKTTIKKIQEKQTYIAYMKKNTMTNLDIISIAEEFGNSEYRYEDEKGERSMNILLLLTTEQGTPTPKKIKQYYNEAVSIHQAKLTTKQGLTLLKINYDSIQNYTELPAGTFLLLTDDNQTNPANTRWGGYGWYDKGYTLLRTWDTHDHNYAVLEVGEGAFAIKDKNSTSSNSYAYDSEYDPNIGKENITEVKTAPLRIALMYKGKTIPDPTQ